MWSLLLLFEIILWFDFFIGNSKSQWHSASRKSLECSVSSSSEAKEILWVFHKARWVRVYSFPVTHVKFCYDVWKSSGKISFLENVPHSSAVSSQSPRTPTSGIFMSFNSRLCLFSWVLGICRVSLLVYVPLVLSWLSPTLNSFILRF